MRKEFSNIDEIIAELDVIIEDANSHNDCLGYFCYVYRRTTARIKQGIENQEFEDNLRMEQFDITFARYYIEAYWKYRRGEKPCKSWETSFHARKKKLALIQHVMMGMNAHINLDLAIAAAKVAPGEKIDSLKNDFMRVNDILEELIDEMQDRLARNSPIMKVVDFLGGRKDEKMINFGMREARGKAWLMAKVLANQTEEEQAKSIERLDNEVSMIGNMIKSPSNTFVKYGLYLLRLSESRDIKKVLNRLSS